MGGKLLRINQGRVKTTKNTTTPEKKVIKKKRPEERVKIQKTLNRRLNDHTAIRGK